MPNGRKRLDWATCALKLAFNIAEYRSEELINQVGAAIIKNDGSIILSYNGAPSGVEIDWSNKEEKRNRVIHAEANATNFILPFEAKLMSCTHLPCPECLKLIAIKKIKVVYYNKIFPHYSPEEVFTIAKEFGIELIKLEI